MLAVIEEEVVSKRHWVEKDDFLDLVVLAQTAPGILAVNISILTGNKIAGKRGAVVSALGAVLPSFITILVIAVCFSQFQNNVWVRKVFNGIRPAVIALIAVPVFSLAKSASVGWKTVWIPVLVALLIWLAGVSPIYIIIVAIASGIVVHWIEIRKGREE